MRVGDFTLQVCDQYGNARSDRDGYVPMDHGQQYSLRMNNRSGCRTNLYIKIDGISVGDFQIEANAIATLERPLGDCGRFTFFAADSSEGAAVGSQGVCRSDKGLVEVVFVPETPQPRYKPLQATAMRSADPVSHGLCRPSLGMMDLSDSFGASARSASYYCDNIPIETCSMKPGVTGMTGHSNQEFLLARRIVEDQSRRTVITLRLVVANGSPAGPRPLPRRLANPVPMPV